MERYIAEAKELRGVLHGIPELAFNEKRTKTALTEYIRRHTGLTLHDGGAWFCAECTGWNPVLPPIALRADFDAVAGADGLPGHYCGHDGHAAALAAFARYLSDHRPERTVYLVFQPAEEIGEGARLCAPLLEEKGVREVYAWHNIPGYPKGEVLLRNGTFACGSTGLEISLTGKPSHAAYPESGRNPARLISDLILRMYDRMADPHRGMVLGTVIGVSLGSDAYGVSASEGVLRLTLRAEYEAEFESFVADMKRFAYEGAKAQHMACEIREIERFAATENDPGCVARLAKLADAEDIAVTRLEQPFRWSEDFGTFLQTCPGAIFGIGDGEMYPQLHTDDFSFPDDILPEAMRMLRAIVYA